MEFKDATPEERAITAMEAIQRRMTADELWHYVRHNPDKNINYCWAAAFNCPHTTVDILDYLAKVDPEWHWHYTIEADFGPERDTRENVQCYPRTKVMYTWYRKSAMCDVKAGKHTRQQVDEWLALLPPIAART